MLCSWFAVYGTFAGCRNLQCTPLYDREKAHKRDVAPRELCTGVIDAPSQHPARTGFRLGVSARKTGARARRERASFVA